MLDIRLIKENPEDIIKRMADKGKDVRAEVEEILKLDGERRALILETDNLKAEQNKVSKEIPKMKKAGEDTAPVFAEMKSDGAYIIKGSSSKISFFILSIVLSSFSTISHLLTTTIEAFPSLWA